MNQWESKVSKLQFWINLSDNLYETAAFCDKVETIKSLGSSEHIKKATNSHPEHHYTLPG